MRQLRAHFTHGYRCWHPGKAGVARNEAFHAAVVGVEAAGPALSRWPTHPCADLEVYATKNGVWSMPRR